MQSINKQLLVSGLTPPTFNNTTQAYDAMDITNFKTVGVQISIVGAGATGSVKLQWSNNGTNWEDIPASNITTAAVAVTVGGTFCLNAINLGMSLLRVFSTSTNASPWLVTGRMIGKEY